MSATALPLAAAPPSRFPAFAWTVLAYNILVIVWGAFVRATGSGAGCGSHWPLCNGDVVPRAPQIATMIEFTHRLTSGLALLGVLAMVVWSFRLYPRGARVRRAAVWSLAFILIEAALGAGLVLFEYVDKNASVGRGFYLSAHLVNTMLLLGALTLTAWWAGGGGAISMRRDPALTRQFLIGFAGTLLIGVSGAVAALGDTLFPVTSVAEGVRQEFSAAAHFLVRLRVLHPFLAVLVSMYVAWLCSRASRRDAETRPLAAAVALLLLVQLIAGGVNVLLLAPVWMQLVHLLLADFLWIALTLLAARALRENGLLPA